MQGHWRGGEERRGEPGCACTGDGGDGSGDNAQEIRASSSQTCCGGKGAAALHRGLHTDRRRLFCHAGVSLSTSHLLTPPFPFPRQRCPGSPWSLLLGCLPPPCLPRPLRLGTLLQLGALACIVPVLGAPSATSGSPWGEGSRMLGTIYSLFALQWAER